MMTDLRFRTTRFLSQDSTVAYTQGPVEIYKYYYKKAEKKKAREEKLAAMTPEERETAEAEAEQRRLAAKIKKDL